MFDLLSKPRNKLDKARIHYDLAIKHKNRRMTEAKAKSKKIMSSPKGLTSAFALGCTVGVSKEKKPSKATLMTTLMKFFI